MDKISDEELVSRIQAGKEEWENVILVRYEDRILSWARMKHLSFVAGGDLDDLLQEGRLGLLKAMYAYDDAKGKSFSSFARICVQSQMISYVMAMTADKNKILNEAVSLSSSDEEGEEPLLERLPGPSKDPESKVIAKELRGTLGGSKRDAVLL